MQKIQIICKDKREIAGLFFKVTHPKAAVIICPATGIKKEFYMALARYLAENKYAVICFDNRGIGASLKGSINLEDADLIDWGKLDMTAAFETLKKQVPNVDYHLIGHSAGGQLVGLMENALELKTIFNVACSSGSIANMSWAFRPKAYFFMNIFIPVCNKLLGHTKSQWVGMGEPLPRNVAAQWSKWCNGRGYVEMEFGHKIKDHFYDKIAIDSIWYYATDDQIACLENVKDMTRVYSKARCKIAKLHPPTHEINQIGHMKFFSKRNHFLWQLVLDWLEKN